LHKSGRATPIEIIESQLSAAAVVPSIVPECEERSGWFRLVAGEPDTSKSLLYHYLTHGESFLFAKLASIFLQIVGG
jgi:hypothetical protein